MEGAEFLDRETSISWGLNDTPRREIDGPAPGYEAQGKYAEAEPLYKRSLAIREKALGPEHPNVAKSLEIYAALLRETGRGNEAEEMGARAQAIRAEHAKENPAK